MVLTLKPCGNIGNNFAKPSTFSKHFSKISAGSIEKEFSYQIEGENSILRLHNFFKLVITDKADWENFPLDDPNSDIPVSTNFLYNSTCNGINLQQITCSTIKKAKRS